MNKYIKQLTESLFDDIDDIFSNDDEDMEILSSLEDIYLPYVDLGLTSGTLWYKCNLGAKKETDPGLYFQWGDTQGYTKDTIEFANWKNYKYCNGTYTSFTKYVTDDAYGIVDNKTQLDLKDDAAYIISNKIMKMPTVKLFKELYDECKWEWTTINNVNGYKVLSKNNGKSIFLPAAGYCEDSGFDLVNNGGLYWSKNLHINNNHCFNAYNLYCYPETIFPDDYSNRIICMPIRPVLKK